MRIPVRRWAATVAATGAILAPGCSPGGDGGRAGGTGGTTTSVAAGTYVAIGASETVGIGADDPLNEAWPKVLYRRAMPQSTVYVNLGIPGITVAGALARELPDALDLNPTVVTVWLNVNDITHLVGPADYERDLRALVRALRRDGRATVLVANTPALDRLPAYRACIAGADAGPAGCTAGILLPGPEVVNAVVDAYNAAIDRVVRDEGAVLVDLRGAEAAARAEGTEADLVSGDGFHPSTAGHQLVADAFADALRAATSTGRR